jgi:hypothetical protein
MSVDDFFVEVLAFLSDLHMSMRSGPQLQEAINWFKDNGIALYGMNEDPSQKKWTQSPNDEAAEHNTALDPLWRKQHK